MPEGFLFLGGFLVLGEEYSRLLVVFLNLFSHRSDRGCSSNKCNRILLKAMFVKQNFKKNLHGGIEIRFNNLVGSIYYIGGVFMKKLLGVLLAVVMSWPAGATVLSNVEVKGEIQTIASDVHHNQAGIYNSGVNARVLAGLSAELVEDVTANLMFQYADTWGDNPDNEGKTVQEYWDNVKLVNANVVLHNLFCAFDLTVGRQFYGDEDSAVMYIGPNHYNAERRFANGNGYAQSIDAAKLVYADDVKTFTMIAGTVNDFGTYLTPEVDYKVDLYGADFRMNLTDGLTAQVYGYDFVSRGDAMPANEDQHAGFYGAKLGMNVDAVRASAEYARNFGGHRLVKEHKDAGYMVKADVAADIEKVTARGTFVYAKADNEEDEFWAWGNYTPGLLIGQLFGGNIWDYSNEGLRLFNVGFDFKPAEKWVLSLDGYTFQSRTGHATTYEADLTAKYNHNEYVQLFAGLGYAKYTSNEKYGATSHDNMLAPDNFKGQIGMLIKF